MPANSFSHNPPFPSSVYPTPPLHSRSTTFQTPFKPPAHKHAHHLHSIPPREKSTRTLIIDHMLWVHGRTRFAQARAELGMTDSTGGPPSMNYAHRKRPENYEEDDDEGSEGEDVIVLKSRTGGPGHPHNDEEDERLGRQDLPLARSLRLRAEGLEKVITSMLEQPPPIHPINDEDILTPPTSPKINPSNQRDLAHPHTLPNGVRLRLALGTIINDLFARQAPHPPYRHTHPSNQKITTPPEQSPSMSLISNLPESLTPLSSISGAFLSQPPVVLSPINDSSYPIQPQQRLSPPTPSQRTHSLYTAGADPSTANSPPAFRCPRHLHTGCEICVEAKSGSRQTLSSSRGRSSSFGSDRSNQNNNNWRSMSASGGSGGGSTGGMTGWQDGSGIGSGLLRPGVKGSALRRKVSDVDTRDGEDGNASTGAGNTKLSKLIPRFIRLSALVATELGREAREDVEEEGGGESEEGSKYKDGSNAGGDTSTRDASSRRQSTSTSLSNDTGRWENSDPRVLRRMSSSSSSSISTSPSTATRTTQNAMYQYALLPTREWYMLLAGLLTRAVLEGYLTAGWRRSHAARCLLMVGLGIHENRPPFKGTDMLPPEDKYNAEEEEFEEFDPDELPSLVDAVKLLFPGLRDGAAKVGSAAEEEYGVEMYERLRKFYDIPASTPDLSTHMEDLAWQFPAEPVERAAVRFCEAIARWRGKPELETYKKKAQPSPSASSFEGSTSMTIESLVHSASPVLGNAIPGISTNFSSHASVAQASRGGMGSRRLKRKPSIDMYFREQSMLVRKRRKDGDSGRAQKRVHV